MTVEEFAEPAAGALESLFEESGSDSGEVSLAFPGEGNYSYVENGVKLRASEAEKDERLLDGYEGLADGNVSALFTDEPTDERVRGVNSEHRNRSTVDGQPIESAMAKVALDVQERAEAIERGRIAETALRKSRGEKGVERLAPVAVRRSVEVTDGSGEIEKADVIAVPPDAKVYRVLVHGNKRNAVLDTMSGPSFVRSEVLQKGDWVERWNRKLWRTNHPFRSASGHRLKIRGIASVTVEGPGGEASFNAYVCDRIPVHLLLGRAEHGVLGVNVTSKVLDGVEKEVLMTDPDDAAHVGDLAEFRETVGAIFGDDLSKEEREILEYIEKQIELRTRGLIEVVNLPPVKLRWDQRDTIKVGYAKPFHLGEVREEALRGHVERLLDTGDIEEARDPSIACPALAVKKPGGKGYRFVVAYGKANDILLNVASPLPRIKDILEEVARSGASVFSTLDLKDAFWQVALTPDSREITTFVTRQGAYWWRVLPQGLKVSAAAFQARMNEVLKEHGAYARVYIDDIIVFSKSKDEHHLHLRRVIDSIVKAGLKISMHKCHFYKSEVKMLGHVVSAGKVSPSKDRVKSLKEAPRPRNLKAMQSFLGATGFYQRFIEGFAGLAEKLRNIQMGARGLIWGPEELEAYDTIVERLSTSVLSHDWDPTECVLRIRSDASGTGLGGVLLANDKPVAFFSRSLNKNQRNYTNTEREMFAVFETIRYFDEYLYGRTFVVQTDHKALLTLLRVRDPAKAGASYTHRVQNWAAALCAYHFTVEHVPGKSLPDSDYLSRIHSDTELNQTVGFIEQARRATSDLIGIDPFKGILGEYLSKRLAEFGTEELGGRAEGEFMKEFLRGKALGKGAMRKLWRRSRRWNFVDGNWVAMHGAWQRIIPPVEERMALARETHELAHEGINSTVERLRRVYTWPGLKEDVWKVVMSCPGCLAMGGGQNVHQADAAAPVPERRFSSIVMDCVGPFPVTPHGHRYVLTIRDLLSRWVEFIPLSDQTAASVVDALYHDWVLRFGVPDSIHFDGGKEFVAQWAMELRKEVWGVLRHTNTLPYNPAGNGVAERANRSLMHALSRLVNNKQIRRDDWDVALSRIAWGVNTQKHDALGCSPFEMVYGASPRNFPMPEGLDRKKWNMEDERDLDELMLLAWKHLDRELGRGVPGVSLKVGDTVYVKKPRKLPKPFPKLHEWADGPFKVVEKNKAWYKVRDVGGTERMYKPARLLKTYIDWSSVEAAAEHAHNLSGGTLDLDDSEDDRNGGDELEGIDDLEQEDALVVAEDERDVAHMLLRGRTSNEEDTKQGTGRPGDRPRRQIKRPRVIRIDD